MMSIREKIFSSPCQEDNITIIAKCLYITQPPLSRQIKQLGI